MVKFIFNFLLFILAFSCASEDKNLENRVDSENNNRVAIPEIKLEYSKRKNLKVEDLYKFIGFIVLRSKVNCKYPEIDLSMKDFGMQNSGPRILKKNKDEKHFHIFCDVIDKNKICRYFIAFSLTPDIAFVKKVKNVEELFRNRKVAQYVIKRFKLDEPTKEEIILKLIK